jgi:CCR4-NOT transcription complex subunit 4
LRVVQKNLVYVVGIQQDVPEHELIHTLRGDKYFGQYGKIIKIVVSKAKVGDAKGSLGVYVTFARKEDADLCISAINNPSNGTSTLRAQLGTTKYCSAYLRNETCTNKACMFLHEAGDNDSSYSRADLSSINGADYQGPLRTATSSSRQVAQPQAPLQLAPVAAASQAMIRDSSKEGSDSGDGSALPSTANWGSRGAQQLSRRGSMSTSGAASSPAISTSMPAAATNEIREQPVEHENERETEASDQGIASLPELTTSSQPKLDTVLMRLIKAINALSTSGELTLNISPEDLHSISTFPPLFDNDGGLKRKAIREREELRMLEQDSQHDMGSISEPQEEEEPESGSGQLGGEPEDRDDSREGSAQPQGFHDTRRPSMQMPIQRTANDNGLFGAGLGQNYSQSIGSNGRNLTPHQMLLLKSGQPQQNFLEQFPAGMSSALGSSQSGLHQREGHVRQPSRYQREMNGSSAKQAASSQALGQQASMIGSLQGNQYFNPSMPGPPPGLKSSGTPPIGGSGLFGQGHGFGGSLGGSAFGAPSRESQSDMLRNIMRERGGMGSGQGHDAGKREFMFPSFLHQYPSASTPAPASGLLASLYGPQPGAFHDFGPKQKKKGKKHRHANTSSSGGGGLVDLADPSLLQARMPLQQQQSNAGVGQGLFGGQGQGGYSQNMMYGGNPRW